MDGIAANVFRQRAIDRLSSPDQLDRLLVVARPRDWIGLVTLAALVLAALVWSVDWSLGTRVAGQGLLVGEGGKMFSAVAASEGNVVRIRVAEGQTVRAGEVLVEIDQPALVQQLANARAAAAEARSQLAGVRRQVGSYARARGENARSQRRTLIEARVNAQARADAFERQLRDSEALLAKGFVTARAVTEARQQAATARQAVSEADSRLIDIDAQQISGRNNDSRDVQAATFRLAEANRQVGDILLQMALRGAVRSPTAGKVTEIKTLVGTRVAPGTQLVAVESGAAGLQLVLFLPPDQGKAARPGMEVRVSPSVIKREEFGTIKGVVRQVSDFPSTADAMRSILQNDDLVTQFSKGGAPFAARVDLLTDAATPTGYAWTGGNGPQTRLTSGTLATAEVTTREQSPISLAIPLLRRATGL